MNKTRKKIIKSCVNRWAVDTCEGMFEGDILSKFCPTCRTARKKALASARYHKWRVTNPARFRELSRKYRREAQAIRKRLGIKSPPKVRKTHTKPCQDCGRDFTGFKLSPRCDDCKRKHRNEYMRGYKRHGNL